MKPEGLKPFSLINWEKYSVYCTIINEISEKQGFIATTPLLPTTTIGTKLPITLLHLP